MADITPTKFAYVLYSDWNYIFWLELYSDGLCNGFMPNGRQATTWANVDQWYSVIAYGVTMPQCVKSDYQAKYNI